MSKMMTSRKDFLIGASSFFIGSSLYGKPRKSLIAERSSYADAEEDLSLIPYVQDGLVSFWDSIWNAGIEKTDNAQRMVDICGRCGNMVVSSGYATFGDMIRFDGNLSFMCTNMKYVNNLIKRGIFDDNAQTMESMVVDLTNVPSSAYNDGIKIYNAGPTITAYPCFTLEGIMYRSIQLVRARCQCCGGNSISQTDVHNLNYCIFQTAAYQHRLNYWSSFSNDSIIQYGQNVESWLSQRLKNEPALADRVFSQAQIYSFTGCAGARFGRLLIYDRHLNEDEMIYNYLVDKERFGL